MAASNVNLLAIFDSFLKVRTMEMINLVRDQTPLLNVFDEFAAKEVSAGRTVEVPLVIDDNNSFGGVIGEMGRKALAGNIELATVTLPVFAHNASAAFGKIGQIKTTSKVQAIKTLMDTVLMRTMSGFARNLDALYWQFGEGTPARIEGAPDADAMTLTVTADSGPFGADRNGVLYLRRGAWMNATSDVALATPDRTTEIQIDAINRDTRVITFTGAIGNAADNDFLTVQDGLSNISLGMLSIDRDATNPYLGRNRVDDEDVWHPVVQRTAGNITIEDEVIIELMKVEEETSQQPFMGVTNREIIQRIFNQSKTDRQFVITEKRGYALGFTSTPIRAPGLNKAVEFFNAANCPGSLANSTGFLAVLEPTKWKKVRSSDPGWDPNEGGGILHQIPGTYGVEATWLDVHCLVCLDPRAQIFISGISNV